MVQQQLFEHTSIDGDLYLEYGQFPKAWRVAITDGKNGSPLRSSFISPGVAPLFKAHSIVAFARRAAHHYAGRRIYVTPSVRELVYLPEILSVEYFEEGGA